MEKEKSINEELNDEGVSFSVDAGIINRLGKELVGRAETAVSELVKNAYDADATAVKLFFIDTEEAGGELHIIDDGHGMTQKQLIKGFMRLSSSEKVHNPVSPKFKRLRAGRKGIGRFATQRLGNKLTILTKNETDDFGFRLEVDWNKYSLDTDLDSIKNPIKNESVDFSHGTKLIIKGLREPWSEAQIKRVFRYVSDLLQPNYLSDRGTSLNVAASDNDESFVVECYQKTGNDIRSIANLDQMVFDNALGVIEGYVLDGKAICEVVSDRFEINDHIEIEANYGILDEVHFKVFYFIYKYKWYEGYIPKMEYNRISNFGENNGGVRLYRNGFRVLPYGERGNDWLNIDKTSVKTSNQAYVPFNNPNFFGFVEVIDPNGELFEETSSREGLIENDAFNQLSDFLNKSLRIATQRINSARFSEKKRTKASSNKGEDSKTSKKSTREKLEELKDKDEETKEIVEEVIQKLEEAEMLRVLAAIGLNIAEFTHEIRQFIPSFNGSINFLMSQDLSSDINETLLNLQENFNRFKSYTNYIDHTLSQNTQREKQPIKINKVVEDFILIMAKDLEANAINMETDYYGFDLYTTPMHPSEWTSILYNLYTNSKKALGRSSSKNYKIKIICDREDENIYLEFMDNGDGIPDEIQNRVFDPFFTTSTPASFDSSKNELATGTGLGLKIIKDIVNSYNGDVFLAEPDAGLITNFRIEIPEATESQLENYGY
jgi:signal transduction histidine kinase